MESNILIIGGTGVVGKTIARILQDRNPTFSIKVGSRNPSGSSTNIWVDVANPDSFQSILENKITMIILSVNDQENHILKFAIQHGIDYLDITKPTPDLMKAYTIARSGPVNSRIIFSSGWMGGIVPGLVEMLADHSTKIDDVKLYVYYSTRDLAGKSSAHFMAENVAKPFVCYKNNQPQPVRHFLNSENYQFSFDIGKRQSYNFDVPDLFILNQIEKIPNVSVKMTYDSKVITWLLGTFQTLRIFDLLSLKQRQTIFGGSGNGDQAVFEIIIKQKGEVRKLSLQSERGQAELTALSAVLHTEEILKNVLDNKIYFSHQIHRSENLFTALKSHPGINIKILY